MGRRVVTGLVCVVVAGVPQPASAVEPQWGAADLSVRISAAPKVAQPGQPLVYRVKVHNKGPGDAVLPVLRVRVPRQIQIIHVNVAECRPTRVYNEVVCESNRDVVAGESGSLTITGLVRPGARGPLRAEAQISSEVLDSRESDNVAAAVTEVDDGADLAVRVSTSVRFARPGQPFAVRAKVRNRGPRTVRDAHLFFQPFRARFVSATGGRCRSRGSFVRCALPPLRSGSANLLRLMFQVPSRASHAVATMATVYSRRLGDRRPANNQARMRLALRGH